jgi:Concanavalin A-like lectin/glucanases superfamily/Putative metal-binding motif/CARDB
MSLLKYYFCLLIIFCCVFSFAQFVPPYIPPNGLVAWYPFNGNANDATGNANNIGTVLGATLTADRYSNLNSAFRFDGVDDYIRGNGVNYPINERTISLWFLLDDLTTHHMFVNYGGRPGTCGTSFLSGLSYPSIFTASHCSVKDALAPGNSIVANKWYNLIITSGSGKTSFYLDGLLVRDTALDYNGMTFPPFFSFGVAVNPEGLPPFSDVNVGYLKGKLDEIGIWNRVLTPQEVQQVFQSNSGSPNNALHFNGSNNRVLLGNNLLLSPAHITLQAWVKADFVGTYRCVVAKRDCCGGPVEQWTLQNEGGRMHFHATTDNIGVFITDPGSLPINVWTHYTATYDGNVARLYKNGNLIVEDFSPDGNISATPTLVAIPAFIGNRQNGGDWWPGAIDEVRIWNRALSQQEVTANFNCELAGTDLGLIAYYNFNQGIAGGNNAGITTLTDKSPNHLNGILNNFTLSGSTSNWVSPSAFPVGTICSVPLLVYYRDSDADGFGNTLIDSIASAPPVGYVLDNTDCNDNNPAIHPNATEICGNGMDEDCNGSDGSCGASLNFDGVNDFVNVPNNINLNLPGNISLEAWINLANTGGNKTIISKFGDTPNDDSYILRVDNGRVNLQLNFGTWTSLVSNTILSPNAWHHIAGTYDGQAMKVYINGNLDNSVVKTGSVNSSGSSVKLGKPGIAITAGNDMFAGRLDEVKIWNIARSQSHIQSSMNCELNGIQPGLIAYYNFNQGIANGNNTSPPINTLSDASGNNNTGTLNNFSLNGSTSNWTSPSPVASGTTCYITYYRDADLDGFGNPLIDSISLTPPTGFVADNADCNDANPNIHPGVIEVCDGIDNNCDGIIDNVSGTPDVAGNTNLCVGTTLSLTASGGNTYQWTGPNGFTASSATITRNNISIADSGNYIVTIGYTGCQQTTVITKQVFVIAPPVAAITGLNNSYCLNDPVSNLTGIPSGGVFSGIEISGNTFNPNFVGKDTVYYISPSYYGCPADTAKFTTTVYELPFVNVSNSGTGFLCKGDSITLTAGSNANNFLWSNGATANSIKVTRPDTLTVTVTNSTGCKKTSPPIIIANDPIPKITTNGGTTICNGQSIQLSFNTNNVVWTPGGNGNTITVSPSANTLYKVKGTSANNCNYKDSIIIKVNPSEKPRPVTSMFPPNNTTGLNPHVTFSWLPGLFNTRYDVHVWKASQSELSGISISTYNISESIVLDLNTQYNWRVISHNGSCKDTVGPVQTFSVRALPDLVVPNINIPNTAVGGQDISVGWQTKNIGAGSTETAVWIDKVYLSSNDSLEPGTDLLVASHLNFSSLTHGQAYNDSAIIHLPVNIAGIFYLIVHTDANLLLTEHNELNNISHSTTPFIIAIPPLPDLQVETISPQTNVFSGDTINITYTIKNRGNFKADHFIKNNIYITSNAQLGDITSLKIAGTDSALVLLQPGASKTFHTKAVIPPHISGTLFVHVYTDATNLVYEGPADNNNSSSTAINVFLTPPADLIVNNFEMADSVYAGSNALFKYTIKNIGFNKTDSSWYVGVFFSRDTFFSLATAIPVKYVYISNNNFVSPGSINFNTTGLSAGDSLNFSFIATVPDSLHGIYNAFVVTDVFNTIFEYNKEGNNILRNGSASSLVTTANRSVTVLAPDLGVSSVTAPASCSAGLTFKVSWESRNYGYGILGSRIRKEAIYFSPSIVFNPATAIFLGDVINAIPLSAEQLIQQKNQVTIPVNISGAGYIFIFADYENAIFESNELNNFDYVAIQVNISHWPDLTAGGFNIPDTLPATSNFSFINEVRNAGSLNAGGSWTDDLYVSRSPSWNKDSSFLLRSLVHNANVPAGGAYSNDEQVSLPFTKNIVNGRDSTFYYFYYVADSKNELFENNGENNNVFRSNRVFVYDIIPDHVLANVTGNDTAYIGRPYNIKWIVENKGYRPGGDYYNQWNDGIVLSPDSIFSTLNFNMLSKRITNPLDHNTSYNNNIFFNAPHGYAGKFYVFVYTDLGNEINGEVNKSNNYNLIRDINGNAKPIHFIELPAADIIADSFLAPTTGIAGQPISVRYSINNKGLGHATGSWVDQISLSAGYTASSNILTNQSHITGLAIDSSYEDIVQAFLPSNANGNYIMVLKTDANNNIFEAGAEMNNLAYSPITIVQLPPCDLSATDIIVPDSALSGTSAFISWKVKNTGINPANGYTREAVYLSSDTVLDNNDPLIGTVSNNITLPANSSVTHSITANLNSARAGNNYVFVRTDLLNNIIESNENNNTMISNGTIFIYMKKLPIEVPVADTLSNSYLNYYEINVPNTLNNATLLISCFGDTLQGNTELYASFGKTPTVTSYDFSANNPYQKKKEIIIPTLHSGVYYLAVKGRVNNARVQNINLLAHILPFAITSVETNHGGNTGNVTVKITGSKFEPGMKAHLLSNNSAVNITAANIIFVNSTLVWATFNLNQQPLGIYNLQLKTANNSIALLNNGFTIEKSITGTFYTGAGNTGMTGTPGAPGCDPGAEGGGNQNLLLTINAPASERTGRNIPITILFSNPGNVDIPVPSRLLVSDVFPIAWTPNFPNYNQKVLYIEFSEPGGPPGILRAGASGGITFYTRVTLPVLNHFVLK